MNDINSLTAFGNSLMAEILRLEAATSTQQKSDFMSSVSHELRSPLHGIIATVELMQENLEDSRLLSMTQMIETCSFTLLDTFDQLLEFSKINSSKGRETTAQLTRAKGNTSIASPKKLAFDLGTLTEDVLEAVSLGHTSLSRMQSGLREHEGPPSNDGEASQLPVLLTTHIEYQSAWTSHVAPGAWKRILLNILSNALRFTESGYIDVSLTMSEETAVSPQCIILSVTDTGMGMSAEFLKYHLFTPFMQENSLISGTGLGLSIVKSIVESLDGEIFVESRRHEGTSVTVNIPLEKELEIPDQPGAGGTPTPDDNLSNSTISLISIASQDAPNKNLAPHLVALPKLLHRSLRNICEKQFGMTVVDDIPLNALLKTDIVLLDTHALSPAELLGFQEHFPEVISTIASRPVVILGSTTKGVEQFFSSRGGTFISSPITRRKLRNAFITALSKVVPTEAMVSQTSSNCNRQPSPQVELTFPGDLSNKIESIITQTKPTTLPVRSASPQAGSNTKGGSTPNPESLQRSHSQSLETVVADSSNSHMVYRFRRLLLVDDNSVNLKLLVAFAKRIGLPFATACNGAEAVCLYKKAVLEEADPFDFVFMDISMPVMDGFQATVAIRQFEEQERKEHQDVDAGPHEMQSPHNGGNEKQLATPWGALSSNIVALTGLGSDEARSMARQSGFNLFLVKPVKFKDVEPLLMTSSVNSKV